MRDPWKGPDEREGMQRVMDFVTQQGPCILGIVSLSGQWVSCLSLGHILSQMPMLKPVTYTNLFIQDCDKYFPGQNYRCSTCRLSGNLNNLCTDPSAGAGSTCDPSSGFSTQCSCGQLYPEPQLICHWMNVIGSLANTGWVAKKRLMQEIISCNLLLQRMRQASLDPKIK